MTRAGIATARMVRTVVVLAALLAAVAASALAKRALVAQIGGSDVTSITGAETWPHVTQSEDQIAVNGSTGVVAYNDSKDVAANPLVFEGMSVSTNGGAAFTRLSPSPFASGHGQSFGDPFAVYDKKLGKWFAGGLAGGCGGQGLGLWTSPDGLTWSPGRACTTARGTTGRRSRSTTPRRACSTGACI